MATADPPAVRVTVEVTYLSAHSAPPRQTFSYLIRIENGTEDTWQLLSRHWEIVDATGRQTLVDGQGVVGEQPVLPPGGVFVYDSFVTVEATPARMGGHYLMQNAWGEQTQVPVPPFLLGLPGQRVLN